MTWFSRTVALVVLASAAGCEAAGTSPGGAAPPPVPKAVGAETRLGPPGWTGTGILLRRDEKLPRGAPAWAAVIIEVQDRAGQRVVILSGHATGIRDAQAARAEAELRARAFFAQVINVERVAGGSTVATWRDPESGETFVRIEIPVPPTWSLDSGHAASAETTSPPQAPSTVTDAPPVSFAEQMRALSATRLVVHRSWKAKRPWPKELEPAPAGDQVVVALDVELSGYGYRIDPDDFLLLDASDDSIVGQSPYCERLTPEGAAASWEGQHLRAQPDLRMVAYFAVPARSMKLKVSYNDKTSAPFQPLARQ